MVEDPGETLLKLLHCLQRKIGYKTDAQLDEACSFLEPRRIIFDTARLDVTSYAMAKLKKVENTARKLTPKDAVAAQGFGLRLSTSGVGLSPF
jgi:hypothetical protein